MIMALIYSSIIILWPTQFTCDILQLYNFDNPRESYYDERRHDFDGLWEEEEEERDFDEDEYYSFKNNTIKYYIFGLAILNFITAMIFERIIVPAFTNIWNMKKMDKLRKRKTVENENNFTMQELFQLNENNKE